jgi:ribonucleoside-diphosphate reductase alpha chain
VWAEALTLGGQHGYRNAQATVLAPTGTIGLLMDCDTTGIEPDFALIKWKKLAGGGYFKIVNQCVPQALATLGYAQADIEAILQHIDSTGTVEGAPGLKAEHDTVFDCASPSVQGKRFIEPLAHVRMMAAAQPFLSGAISKTVNLPHNATVEEIESIYVTAWQLGLKGVALYRDGSKFSQPLSGSEQPAAPIKSNQPFTDDLSVVVSVGDETLRLTSKAFSDQSVAEITVDGIFSDEVTLPLLQCLAFSMSVAFQAGVPLETFLNAFTFTRFGPAGLTDHPNIRHCKSLVDLLVRILGVEYSGRADLAPVAPDGAAAERIQQRLQAQGEIKHGLNSGVKTATGALMHRMGDAPPCSQCGSPTLRDGACYRCDNCGHSQGCS